MSFEFSASDQCSFLKLLAFPLLALVLFNYEYIYINTSKQFYANLGRATKKTNTFNLQEKHASCWASFVYLLFIFLKTVKNCG